MSPTPNPESAVNPLPDGPSEDAPNGTTRRRFMGYVLAGTTLAVAADVAWESVAPGTAHAAEGVQPITSNPTFADEYDFLDLYRDSCRPTNHLLSIEVTDAGKAHFDMPRAEVGQGIETSVAQVIADEMDIPFESVLVTLADARPELMFNQLTGGSTTLYSLWEPLRAASALARRRLMEAAAQQWGVSLSAVRTRQGAVLGPDGRMATYGSLSRAAAASKTTVEEITLGEVRGTAIGKPILRTDALAAVTGKKKYTMDLDVPNALPTMVARPPTFNGKVVGVRNLETVKKMPGVTDVGVITSGVAVRAKTFGQCVDAIRALRVDWGPGTKDKSTSQKLLEEIASVQLPMAPAAPASEVIEEVYRFQFRTGSPMETNNAIADVRSDSAEIWGSFKMPIRSQEKIAERVGLTVDQVTTHVITGGGSFGRHLFEDAALEAAEASKLFGKPVRLMWHRTDDIRHGRMAPAAATHCRAEVVGNSVTSFTLRHASAATDFTHGFGDLFSGRAIASPDGVLGNLGTVAFFFQTVTQVPYNFGPTNVALNEVFRYDDLPTSAVRNVYSPNVCVAREMLVEKLAQHFNLDGYEFRKAFLKSEKSLAVLDAVAKEGNWGRRMKPGTAQAIAFHEEYKCHIACLMEIDNRPAAANRKIRDAYAGPRITKAIMAIDIGKVINPSGLEAMVMGGMIDGIAYAMSAGLHIKDGLPLEGSWDDYRYARQWNTPSEFKCIIMPDNRSFPGGAGEVGIAVAYAAASIAMANVTNTHPTEFPLNFNQPLGFAVKSRTPSIPQSPINGLRFAR